MAEFKKEHHKLVWSVLRSLNAPLLERSACYFGGGTRIVLELDEYRESVDIDLLCADRNGYRELRGNVTQSSFGDIFTGTHELMRDIRMDMYGIRTYLLVEEQPIKFEIIAEGRIELTSGGYEAFPIPTLDHQSCVAEKLLANADRGRDQVTHSRDLIDLAFMAASWNSKVFDEGLSIAEGAYGAVVLNELIATLTQMEDEAYRRECTTGLGVSNTRKLNRGLALLRERAGD